jgi:trigger factor
MALVEGCKHSLEITVPVVEVEKETERVVAEIQKKVRLPGFRPGKAPVGLVKQRFAGDIRQDVLEKIVPRFFHATAEKEQLQVVGQPNVTDVHFHAGEPLTFKAEFEVAPKFDLGEYRGITITYNEPEVTDAEVDARIEEIREQKAEYVNEDPRPLATGDYAVVSLESLAGVAEKVSQDELMLKIGDEQTMKEFSENLTGASPEESREFEVTYPEDYDRKQLAGRTVKFKATVKAVRRKELPEVNDEFAKDLGDYQTVFELREAVRKSLKHDREHKAQDAAKQQLIDKLVDGHDFAVPDAYIDRQVEINVENQLRTLAAQGIDPRGIKLDWAKVRETQKAIGATQEEIDREVQKIARQQREAVAVTRAKLQKEGVIGRIAGNIRTEKTLAFLFEHATKQAAPEEPAATT